LPILAGWLLSRRVGFPGPAEISRNRIAPTI
jgi:hypothetical protein